MKKALVLASIACLVLGFTPAWGDTVEVEAQIAELEARVDQLEKREAAPAVISHHSHGHEGHNHAQIAMSDLELHAGLDLRYLNQQGGASNLFIHEAEIGIGANLSKNVYGLVKFAQHYGENMEIHDAYLTYNLDKLSLLAGKTRVKFGLENQYCFYSRRTITPSAAGSVIFGDHGWHDTGIAVSTKTLADTAITFSVERGNQEGGIFSTGTDEANDCYPVVLDISSKIGPIKTGVSYASGKWDAAGQYNANVSGANAVFSSGPVEIVGEYLTATKQTVTGDITSNGYYVLGILKPADKLEFLISYGIGNDGSGSKETRIGFQPTLKLADNAKLRAIYENRKEAPIETDNNRLIVQLAYEI